MEMCRWFLDQFKQDETFIQRLWFSDEAHFYTNGYVNSKNYIYWGSAKPGNVYEKGLHDQKITVWAAMGYQGIIGPFFFVDEQQHPVTVNSDRYVAVLSKFWRSLGRFVGDEGRQNQHFQQDGAAPHVSKAALRWIRDHFGDRTVSRGTGHSWAANSPDLSPLDFHIWGYLKDKVCGENLPIHSGPEKSPHGGHERGSPRAVSTRDRQFH